MLLMVLSKLSNDVNNDTCGSVIFEQFFIEIIFTKLITTISYFEEQVVNFTSI